MYIIVGILSLRLKHFIHGIASNFYIQLAVGKNLIWIKCIWKHTPHRRLLISWGYFYFYLLKLWDFGCTTLVNLLLKGIINIYKCAVVLQSSQMSSITNTEAARSHQKPFFLDMEIKMSPKWRKRFFGSSIFCVSHDTSSFPYIESLYSCIPVHLVDTWYLRFFFMNPQICFGMFSNSALAYTKNEKAQLPGRFLIIWTFFIYQNFPVIFLKVILWKWGYLWWWIKGNVGKMRGKCWAEWLNQVKFTQQIELLTISLSFCFHS